MKLAAIFESVATYLGDGKYKGYPCFILGTEANGKLRVQFLDGKQLHGVDPSEVRRLKAAA